MENEKTDSPGYHTVATLSRIADVKQRSYALAERINQLESDEAVDLIKEIRQKATEGNGDCLRLYNGLLACSTLSDVLGHARFTELVQTAHIRGEFEIVALLTDLPCRDRGDRPYQPFLDGPLKETPLGMRKSLALKPDFKLIQRIVKDQDHRVIEQLLNNPRLTERDVIQIGATRPTSPSVLEAIYNNKRWISRYRVKKTVVFNPYCPPAIALRLLAFLTLPDLELLCHLSEVDRMVLEEAEKILGNKPGGTRTEYSLELP